MLSCRRSRIAATGLTLAAAVVSAAALRGATGEDGYARLAGAEAEEFLSTARVVERESIPTGITRPKRLTLSDGQRTARAIWKTVDIYRHLYRSRDGRTELGFRDSYRHEVAAYELDKLLGLGLVPPTVERRVDHEPGSLQLWIEDAMTETERRELGVPVPDIRRWNEHMQTVNLVRQLLDDSDFRNISNILVNEQFQVWAIDHSRAFRLGRELRDPEALERFSRTVLEGLRALDEATVRQRLKRWLTPDQIRALLSRRDLILARADRLVAERGAAVVLFR